MGLIIKIIENFSPDIMMFQETRSPLDPLEELRLVEYGFKIYCSQPVRGRNGVITLVKSQYCSTALRREYFSHEIEAGRCVEVVLFLPLGRILLTNVYVNQGGSYNNGKCSSRVTASDFLPGQYEAKVNFLTKIMIDSERNPLNRLVGGDFNVVYKDTDS